MPPFPPSLIGHQKRVTVLADLSGDVGSQIQSVNLSKAWIQIPKVAPPMAQSFMSCMYIISSWAVCTSFLYTWIAYDSPHECMMYWVYCNMFLYVFSCLLESHVKHQATGAVARWSLWATNPWAKQRWWCPVRGRPRPSTATGRWDGGTYGT